MKKSVSAEKEMIQIFDINIEIISRIILSDSCFSKILWLLLRAFYHFH